MEQTSQQKRALRAARALPAFVVAVVTLALTLGSGLQARQRIIKKYQQGQTHQVNDFERWMVMTPQFMQGQGQYRDDSFPTPPITLLMFAPFTYLSAANAQLAWALAKWPLILLIVYCCVRLVANAGIGMNPLAWLLFGLVWVWPVMGDIQQGQTNLVMLTPLMVGLVLAQRAEGGRRGEEWWAGVLAGVCVALAICIKVTPLIFLVYFMVRRRWVIAGSIVAGMALWLLVVPGVALGWDRNLAWLGEWARIMILPYVTKGQVQYYFGQSLPSMLTRFMRHVPAFLETGRQVYVNVVDWPEPVVNRITRVVLGGMGVAGLWWMRRPLGTLRCPRYLAELGAVCIFMLWASERSWIPHYVSIAAAVLAVAAGAADRSDTEAARKRASVALIVAAVLMLFTTDVAKVFFGRDGAEYVRAYGIGIWAAAALLWGIVRGDEGRELRRRNVTTDEHR